MSDCKKREDERADARYRERASATLPHHLIDVCAGDVVRWLDETDRLRARVAELEAENEGYVAAIQRAIPCPPRCSHEHCTPPEPEAIDRLSEQLRASHRKLDEVEPGAFRWRNLRDRFDERLADARREGAESMRERAVTALEEQAEMFELVAAADEDDPVCRAAKRTAGMWRSAAAAIRAIPLDGDAREDAQGEGA